jgi:hypothetical protein
MAQEEDDEVYIPRILSEIYDTTIESDFTLEGDVDKINYCKALYRATAENKVHKIKNLVLCMFNCEFEGSNAVMILITIPINPDADSDSIQPIIEKQATKDKNMAEKIMKVIKLVERRFVTLDDIKLETKPEEKFTYLRMIKKVAK